MNNITHPQHYNHGSEDLIESWYKTYPFDEFVAIMQSHIDKYVSRHRFKGKPIEDLEKAETFLRRLKEYHEKKGEKL